MTLAAGRRRQAGVASPASRHRSLLIAESRSSPTQCNAFWHGPARARSPAAGVELPPASLRAPSRGMPRHRVADRSGRPVADTEAHAGPPTDDDGAERDGGDDLLGVNRGASRWLWSARPRNRQRVGLPATGCRREELAPRLSQPQPNESEPPGSDRRRCLGRFTRLGDVGALTTVTLPAGRAFDVGSDRASDSIGSCRAAIAAGRSCELATLLSGVQRFLARLCNARRGR